MFMILRLIFTGFICVKIYVRMVGNAKMTGWADLHTLYIDKSILQLYDGRQTIYISGRVSRVVSVSGLGEIRKVASRNFCPLSMNKLVKGIFYHIGQNPPGGCVKN